MIIHNFDIILTFSKIVAVQVVRPLLGVAICGGTTVHRYIQQDKELIIA